MPKTFARSQACAHHRVVWYRWAWMSSLDWILLRCCEDTWISSLSRVSTCQILIEFTSKISLPLWQPTRWIHSHSLSPSCLPVLKVLPFPPSFTPSLLFHSLYFPPPVVLKHGGVSPCSVPSSLWLDDDLWQRREASRWMARFKITCGGVWKCSGMMDECGPCMPIKTIFLPHEKGSRSIHWLQAASPSNFLFSVPHPCVLKEQMVVDNARRKKPWGPPEECWTNKTCTALSCSIFQKSCFAYCGGKKGGCFRSFNRTGHEQTYVYLCFNASPDIQ